MGPAHWPTVARPGRPPGKGLRARAERRRDPRGLGNPRRDRHSLGPARRAPEVYPYGHASLPTDVTITRTGVSSRSRWTGRCGSGMQPLDKPSPSGMPTADVVETVAICPDGRTLLSGSINDSHLRIWDLQTLEPSTVVEGPFNSIEKITVGAAGPHRPVRRRRHLARFPEHPRPERPRLAPPPAGACGPIRRHNAERRRESGGLGVAGPHPAPVEPRRGRGSSPPQSGCRTRRCRDSPPRKLGRCWKRIRHSSSPGPSGQKPKSADGITLEGTSMLARAHPTKPYGLFDAS